MGSGAGGGSCFFSLSFLLLLHSLCASVPFPTPPNPLALSMQRHPFGDISVPLLSLRVQAPTSKACSPPTCHGAASTKHWGAQRNRPAQSCSFWEAFALKVISINKPTSAWFVSCLGFVWRWKSLAGRRMNGRLLANCLPRPTAHLGEGSCPKQLQRKQAATKVS